MQTSPSPSFGALLRQCRRAAGLTQEALAERAGLGRATIDSLERGTRQAPRKETVALLAEALQLSEGERTLLEAAARGHRRDSQPPLTLLTASEPPTLPAAGSHALSEAAPFLTSQAPGTRVARLLTHKRLAGLISGLLFAVMLGGALFLQGEPGSPPTLRGRTLCLATDFPTSGLFAFTGKSGEDAVNLAVRQNQQLGNGYTLEAVNYDEASSLHGLPDPSTGAQNIQRMVQNQCIVGLIGPYSSRVAIAEMPVAANAGLVMISPSNTDPGLTLRPLAELENINFEQLHPAGKRLNYFRIASTNVAQAKVDASLLFDLLAQSVYVVDDSNLYGVELANLVEEQFQLRGGRLLGRDSLQPGKPALTAPVAARIVAARPDAVFYGGVTAVGGGLLKAQLVNLGYTGYFVGGDGIATDPGFVKDAGANAANGTFASAAAPDPSTFTSGAAAQFVRDYHARYPDETLDPYSANAYDAAMVLITAIKHLIQTRQAVTRAAMCEQVQHIQYAGVTGPISFDQNGDITHGVFSIYEVRNGRWVYVQQVSA